MMQKLLLHLLLLLLVLLSVCLGNYFQDLDKSLGKQSCFCQLSGQIDDCCCTIEDVDKLNKIYIYPRLNNLVQRNFFRYFKLKLRTECPFWPEDHQCAVKDCKVDRCARDELPVGLKGDDVEEDERGENIYSKEANENKKVESGDTNAKKSCSRGKEESLGDIDTTISDEQKTSLEAWSVYDSDTSFCVDLEEDSNEAEWVDLLLNPEAYTGYQGIGANRIWRSIYQENCFLPNIKMRDYEEFKSSFLSNTCLEKRAFYRTVSGLHASINIHLSYKSLTKDSFSKPRFEPNLDEFRRRFDTETTNGNGPHWLKNLFFTYLLTLRAVIKAAPYWKDASFYTGLLKEDLEVKNLILELVSTAKTCPSTFDETQMFSGNNDEARALKEEFRLHYKNITRIMDCVGCEKCRLWGKLQTTGIGTALKILFSSEKWDEVPVINGKRFTLSRTEIVALFNALNKLSNSIYYIEEFKKLNKKRK